MVNIEDEVLLNLPPARFVHRGVMFVGHRTDNHDGLQMLDAGYSQQFDTTISARRSQFPIAPRTNDEVVLIEDGEAVFTRVANATRIGQDRIMVDFDLKFIRADEAKYYELSDDGRYVLTQDGQRIPIEDDVAEAGLEQTDEGGVILSDTGEPIGTI